MDDREREFHQAMVRIYERARDEIAYLPTYFIQMVSEKGGVQAAKELVTRTPSDGFTTLWGHQRLDLSVEAHVVLPRFAPLFTPHEREQARQRLLDYGFPVERWLRAAAAGEEG